MARVVERIRMLACGMVNIHKLERDSVFFPEASYRLCIGFTEVLMSREELIDLGEQIDQILKRSKAVVDVEV